MEAQVCKICGAKKTNIGVHALRAHSMTPEQYEAYESSKGNTENDQEFAEEFDAIDSIENNTTKVEPKQVQVSTENVNKYEDYTIKQFCNEMAITTIELINIVREFKSGKPRNQLSILKSKLNIGIEKAEKLSNEKFVRTSDSFVADALTKKFGFICTKVERSPKVWVLEKRGSAAASGY